MAESVESGKVGTFVDDQFVDGVEEGFAGIALVEEAAGADALGVTNQVRAVVHGE
jgi:hypothetical protein